METQPLPLDLLSIDSPYSRLILHHLRQAITATPNYPEKPIEYKELDEPPPALTYAIEHLSSRITPLMMRELSDIYAGTGRFLADDVRAAWKELDRTICLAPNPVDLTKYQERFLALFRLRLVTDLEFAGKEVVDGLQTQLKFHTDKKFPDLYPVALASLTDDELRYFVHRACEHIYDPKAGQLIDALALHFSDRVLADICLEEATDRLETYTKLTEGQDLSVEPMATDAGRAYAKIGHAQALLAAATEREASRGHFMEDAAMHMYQHATDGDIRKRARILLLEHLGEDAADKFMATVQRYDLSAATRLQALVHRIGLFKREPPTEFYSQFLDDPANWIVEMVTGHLLLPHRFNEGGREAVWNSIFAKSERADVTPSIELLTLATSNYFTEDMRNFLDEIVRTHPSFPKIVADLKEAGTVKLFAVDDTPAGPTPRFDRVINADLIDVLKRATVNRVLRNIRLGGMAETNAMVLLGTLLSGEASRADTQDLLTRALKEDEGLMRFAKPLAGYSRAEKEAAELL